MNQFEISKQYETIINDLKEGKRVHLHLKDDAIKLLQDSWQSCLDEMTPEALQLLEKIICIVDHCHQFDSIWTELIIKSLQYFKNKTEYNEMIVLTLGTAHTHVILSHQRLGERIPMKFVKELEGLLETQDPDVLEWTLRTIEALGRQSLFLKERVLASRPGFLKRFQTKWKNSVELIKFMEDNWG